MITAERAWSLIDERIEALPAESVQRAAARGRVLTEAVLATIDVPGDDVSAMDGYATPAVEDGAKLAVTGVVAAGDPPGAELTEGAFRIMTGAPAPAGTDRVIPIEETDGGAELVTITTAGRSGQHIRRRGEIVQTGEPVFEAGTRLSVGGLGQLATHGVGAVAVHRRPKVAYMTTGDEVVPPEQIPQPGQLRDSHSDFFHGALDSLGLESRSLGIVPDRPSVLLERVERGMESDVLLLSGGVSMGEFDFVEDVLARLGCQVLVDAVAIQPGKPMVAARHDGGWVFGLPGNPASAMVTFWLFVKPLLHRLQGIADGYLETALDAELDGELPRAKGRDRFLPAALRFDDGRLFALPIDPLGSHDVAAYGRGSALVQIPARSDPKSAGERCRVLPLVDWTADR